MPLTVRIHEGIVETNRDKRTLMDKMIALLGLLDIEQSYYCVADRYDMCRKIVKGLLAQSNLAVRPTAPAHAPPLPRRS